MTDNRTDDGITREDIRKDISTLVCTEKMAAWSRQEGEQAELTKKFSSQNDLLAPPYDPFKLYAICEASAIVPQCIEAMVYNIDGFGHDMAYIGPAGEENDPKVLAEKKGFENYIGKINEKDSFTTVRKSFREDLEKTGNGYFEIIRDQFKRIVLIYRADARYMRLQKLQEDAQVVKVSLFRGKEYGKVEIEVRKRFRRFAMIIDKTKSKVKWFKEYGDPRKMDAISGKYENELEKDETIKELASEILHFKIGNETYGIPRWAGAILTVMGLRSADYVNWDLFDNQVVPPLAILVSGGKLVKESLHDIRNIMKQKRGLENFNKILILEAQGEGAVGDRNNARVELKEMSFARKEDAMFVKYTDNGEHRVRGCFRLPPLYLGRSDSYSKSTADSSKMVAEEQVFVPERLFFDSVMNSTIFGEAKLKYWVYKSKGPRLVAGTDIIDGFKVFGSQGVFSINEGIRLANSILGTDIAVYDKEWANIPIPIVLFNARYGASGGTGGETGPQALGDMADATESLTDVLRKFATDQKNEAVMDLCADLELLAKKVRDELD